MPSTPQPRLKSARELDQLAAAARAVREVLDLAVAACSPGVTTARIAEIARRAMHDRRADPLFLGYRQGDSPPFPAVVCISVNDEVVHGLPGQRTLAAGDLVSIDAGLRLDGWCADAAASLVIPGDGASTSPARELVARTRSILDLAATMMHPGERWSTIARTLEHAAVNSGCGVVIEYVGHGIGADLHEAPKAPAYWTGFAGEDFTLEPGMVLAIEPILTRHATPPAAIEAPSQPARRTQVRLLDDGWTVVTADGSLACHEEHMIAVTPAGPRVLTRERGAE
jgi:methionyl aminopeptidase